MKFYLLFLPLLFAFIAVDAQPTVTQVDFSCPGGITVTYDLIAPQPVDVTLYYSPDKCTWLQAITVTGDVEDQTTGTNKTIVWNNFADSVSFGKFYFKLEAPQPTPDCVMINGVCWATSNLDVGGVFCANPYDYGALYQWGRRSDGHESRTPAPPFLLGPVSGTNLDGNGQPAGSCIGAFLTGNYDWRTPSDGTLWNSGTETSPIKTVNDPCPAAWRMPTQTEQNSLTNTTNVNRVWTQENGINGYRLTDINTGNTIFLPAAGYRYYSNGSFYYVGTGGAYWSSTPYYSTSADYLFFTNSGIFVTSIYDRADGLSVRCVVEN